MKARTRALPDTHALLGSATRGLVQKPVRLDSGVEPDLAFRSPETAKTCRFVPSAISPPPGIVITIIQEMSCTRL
jgi:hypothetical protein